MAHTARRRHHRRWRWGEEAVWSELGKKEGRHGFGRRKRERGREEERGAWLAFKGEGGAGERRRPRRTGMGREERCPWFSI